MATPRLRFAVVDSGPLIKGVRLETLNADALVTVPEVLREIRDRRARDMLASLPVELETREPSGEAMAAIKDFARKTGDLPALSVVDLRVLALAYMLEKEAKGTIDHLRTTPAPPPTPRGRPQADSATTDGGPPPYERAEEEVEVAVPPSDVELITVLLAERQQARRSRDFATADGLRDQLIELGVEIDDEARTWRMSAATATVTAAAAGDDEEEVEEVEEVFDDAPMAVRPYLYVGSVESAAKLSSLRDAGITYILTVAAELPTPEAIEEKAAAAAAPGAASAAAGSAQAAPPASPKPFTRLHVPLRDAEAADLPAFFPSCRRFLDEARAANAKVLVHCVAGRSRAAAVAAAYLMATGEESSAADAVAAVERARPWIEVHPTLMEQLTNLEPSLVAHAPAGASSAVDVSVGEEALYASVSSLALEQLPPPLPVESTPPSTERTPWFESLGGGDGDGESSEAAVREAKAAARARAEAALLEAAKGQLEEDEGLPWVTVENLVNTQRADPTRRAAALDARTKVACLTTDYAMQSVLMQMGLPLMGADGMMLRSVKQWVLRCSGCFSLQPSLDKQFCFKCGNSSLVRLQAVLDARGFRRVLPESGAPARVRSTNTRGTKFPMPMPISGRKANNIIVAEDQLQEAKDKFNKQGKARTENVFDPDYSLDDHFGRSGKKGGGGSGAPTVGYGKRVNPNDVRGRPRRH